MSKIPEIKDMMKAGLHFGHKTSKWNPKMKQYIYGIKSGVHIFDLEQTRNSLVRSLEAIKETIAKGGVVLFLGTKKQARKVVKKYAEEVDCPFITEGWVGGTITNWSEISKLIKKLDELEARAASDDYEAKYTKRERGVFQEEIDKLMMKVGGIRKMKKVPELIYIAGVRDEKTAVKEAKAKGVRTTGIVDTNVDPELVDYPIVANDDAIKSLEMITSLVADAVKEGRVEYKQRQAEEKSKGEQIKKV